MLKSLALAVALAFGAACAQAHSSGHGAIDPDQALVAAVTGADLLTRTKVDRDWSLLDQSWVELKTDQAKLLAIVDGEYVVAVTNPQDGRVFYMLIGGNGAVVDANFTGTFPYVWDLQTDGAQPPE